MKTKTSRAVQVETIVQLRSQYRAELGRFRMWAAEIEIQAAILAAECDLIDRNSIYTRPLTPQEHLQALKEARVPCDNCPGDGVYRWGGTVNGKPLHQNTCYRCNGKGSMNASDCARTRTYFNRQRVV